MQPDMKVRLTTFIGRLKEDRKITSLDEASTKQAIILPLLSLLGWDPFNIDEVRPEHPVGTGNIDYSLRAAGGNKVFIEVKKIGEELEGHQEQLLNYSFKEGVELALLSNGLTWWFYLPLEAGSWEQRKFYTIDFLAQESEEIADRLIDILSKQKVIEDKAAENAREIYRGRKKQQIIKKTINEAWNRAISEVDEGLIELLSENTEKICGYRPENQLVEEFLTNFRDRFLISEPLTVLEPKKKSVFKIRRKTPSGFTGKTIIGFSFRGSNYNVRSWRGLLTKLCEVLNNIHGSDFKKVLGLRGRKRPYFTLNPNELRAPYRIKGSNISVETNMSARSTVKICYEVLALLGYPKEELKIEMR